MDICLTIFGTTVSGVCVFVIKELIQIYYFDVAKMYRKIKSDVASALILYNDLILNPVLTSNSKENYKIAKMEFKKLSSELISFSEEHPLFMKIKLSSLALEKAVIGLIGLSDNLIINDLNIEKAIKCNNEYKNNIIAGLNFKIHI